MSISSIGAGGTCFSPAQVQNLESKEKRCDDRYERGLKALEDHIQNDLAQQGGDLNDISRLKRIFHYLHERAILLRDGLMLDMVLVSLNLQEKTETLCKELSHAVHDYDEIPSGEEKIPYIKEGIARLVRLCKNLEPQSPEDSQQSVEENDSKLEDLEEQSVTATSTSDVERPQVFQQTVDKNEAKSEDQTRNGGTLTPFQNWMIERQAKNELTLEDLGSDNWDGTAGIVSLDDHLYIVQNNNLYRVDPTNGFREQLGGDVWKNTAAMCTLGVHLYIVQDNNLYRVDCNGNYGDTYLGKKNTWKKTAAMCALSDHLYIIQNNNLYRVNPNNGDWGDRYLGKKNAWKHTAAMCALGDYLYIVQNKSLYQVDPRKDNDIWDRLGEEGNWENTTAMTVSNDRLYIVKNDHLYEIEDLKTGVPVPNDLGGGYSHAHAHAFPNSNIIYVVQDKLKTVVTSSLVKGRRERALLRDILSESLD